MGKILAFALPLCVLVLPTLTFAQGQGGGQNRPNPARVCFYSDAAFAGESFCVNPNGLNDALGLDWNDRISSIRVGRNSGGVELCRDNGFAGGCQFFGADTANLGAFNDAASSFRVGQRSPAPPVSPVPSGQACFYENFDYGGSSFCRSAGEVVAALGTDWNDRISSIRIGDDVWVQVCSDFNFGGSCNSVGSGVGQMPPSGNDNISSLRVFAR
jgi:hypothetical protein